MSCSCTDVVSSALSSGRILRLLFWHLVRALPTNRELLGEASITVPTRCIPRCSLSRGKSFPRGDILEDGTHHAVIVRCYLLGRVGPSLLQPPGDGINQ